MSASTFRNTITVYWSSLFDVDILKMKIYYTFLNSQIDIVSSGRRKVVFNVHQGLILPHHMYHNVEYCINWSGCFATKVFIFFIILCTTWQLFRFSSSEYIFLFQTCPELFRDFSLRPQQASSFLWILSPFQTHIIHCFLLCLSQLLLRCNFPANPLSEANNPAQKSSKRQPSINDVPEKPIHFIHRNLIIVNRSISTTP